MPFHGKNASSNLVKDCVFRGGYNSVVECVPYKHEVGGSIPSIPNSVGGVVQRLECWDHTPNVRGSIPFSASVYGFGGIGRHVRLKICFLCQSIGSSPISRRGVGGCNSGG